MICPICGKELTSQDKLIVRYYSPNDWWVTEHLMIDNKGVLILRNEAGELKHWSQYCAQADIQTVNFD